MSDYTPVHFEVVTDRGRANVVVTNVAEYRASEGHRTRLGNWLALHLPRLYRSSSGWCVDTQMGSTILRANPYGWHFFQFAIQRRPWGMTKKMQIWRGLWLGKYQ